MAKTIKSRFLPISNAEPNLNAGWSIRILDYKDMKSLVAVVNEFTEFSFTQELNGPGEGSITLDADSPFWTAILDNGSSNRALMDRQYVIEAWDNDTPRFAWLAQTVSNTVLGEDETRAVVLSGPGIAQTLTWAVINRPGWPTPVPIIGHQPDTNFPKDRSKDTDIYRAVSETDMLSAYSWQFPVEYPTMRMWYTVFKAAQRRGLLPFVSLMFTALADSGKKPWQVVQTKTGVATKEGYKPEQPNENLLDFLSDCTGQDYNTWFGQRLEWIMYPGFKLDVRTRIGIDRSKDVRFFQGNIISDERTRDREGIYNRVITRDVIGVESNAIDKASIEKWNIRERIDTSQKQITDPKTRDQLAARFLKQSKDEKDEWAIKIPYDDPGRVPYRNFFVGDDIGISVDNVGLTPTATNIVSYKVLAITVRVTNDSLVPECELTLRSMIESKQRELQRQLTYILNHPQPVKLENNTDVYIHLNDGKTVTGATPDPPNTKTGLVYDPIIKKWTAAPVVVSAGTGNAQVYVQEVDPATQPGITVNTGDFWYDTNG